MSAKTITEKVLEIAAFSAHIKLFIKTAGASRGKYKHKHGQFSILFYSV